MTNFEKWRDQVMELKDDLAVVNGVPCSCDATSCSRCDFVFGDCASDTWYWLWEEYDVPTPETKPNRINDIERFTERLEDEIKHCETAEKECVDDCEYAMAMVHRAYANALHDILGTIKEV